MAYSVVSLAGAQPIADTSTVQRHALGTIVRGNDSSLGEGEFIYLQGIGSTAIGSVVTYDAATFLTALAPATINIPAPIAISMSANVASQFGWYQISGNAVAAKAGGTSIVARAAVAVQTAGGFNASATGLEVQGAVVAVTATTTATTIQVLINRPHMMGRTVA